MNTEVMTSAHALLAPLSLYTRSVDAANKNTILAPRLLKLLTPFQREHDVDPLDSVHALLGTQGGQRRR